MKQYKIIDLQGCGFLETDYENNIRWFKNKSEIRNTIFNIALHDGSLNECEDMRKLTLNDLLEIWDLEIVEVKI